MLARPDFFSFTAKPFLVFLPIDVFGFGGHWMTVWVWNPFKGAGLCFSAVDVYCFICFFNGFFFGQGRTGKTVRRNKFGQKNSLAILKELNSLRHGITGVDGQQNRLGCSPFSNFFRHVWIFGADDKRMPGGTDAVFQNSLICVRPNAMI